jgi:hypothetical protein
VAHYSIRYGDGEIVRVPVRERFEIAAIPMKYHAAAGEKAFESGAHSWCKITREDSTLCPN